jgi:hypothetical protein
MEASLQLAKDLKNTLNRLHNKGKDDGVNDPTGEFRKLDSLLPQKRGQTPADWARDIEGALDWIGQFNMAPVGGTCKFL